MSETMDRFDASLGRVDKLLSTARIILAAVVALVACAFSLGVAVRQQQAEMDKLRTDVAALTLRVSAIEADRAERLREYQGQMTQIQRSVDKLSTDSDWIKAALKGDG